MLIFTSREQIVTEAAETYHVIIDPETVQRDDAGQWRVNGTLARRWFEDAAEQLLQRESEATR